MSERRVVAMAADYALAAYNETEAREERVLALWVAAFAAQALTKSPGPAPGTVHRLLVETIEHVVSAVAAKEKP